jgi:hypothetical protein
VSPDVIQDEVRQVLATLKEQRLKLLTDQESARTLIAKNMTLLREVDATIAEAEAFLVRGEGIEPP